jgi:hypothetical protein
MEGRAGGVGPNSVRMMPAASSVLFLANQNSASHRSTTRSISHGVLLLALSEVTRAYTSTLTE